MNINFSDILNEYFSYRKFCGMKESSTNSMKIFYRQSCKVFPGEISLTQAMIDRWWQKTPTENPTSHASRIYQVLPLLKFIKERYPEVSFTIPKLPKWKSSQYIPHTFTQEELARFFEVCDHKKKGKDTLECRLNELEDPAVFRLLLSTGMRTTEVRLLKAKDVNLVKGIIYIRKDATKGYRERMVVLHDTMLDVLRIYDKAVEKLMPDRMVFFPNDQDAPHSTLWVNSHFRRIWAKAGNPPGVVPYGLRHHFIIENINSWTDKGCSVHADLVCLSRYVGHSKVQKTYSYYAYVPRLGDEIENRSKDKLDDIIPTIKYRINEEYDK